MTKLSDAARDVIAYHAADAVKAGLDELRQDMTNVPTDVSVGCTVLKSTPTGLVLRFRLSTGAKTVSSVVVMHSSMKINTVEWIWSRVLNLLSELLVACGIEPKAITVTPTSQQHERH